MKRTNMRQARKISNTIKKIKSSSSWQEKDYLTKVKQQFMIEENEKWVVTKLRMMLFKEGANLELFQLQLPTRSKPETQEKEGRNHQKDTVLKKTSMINRALDVPAAKKQVMRKPRLSLEEKQLMKLRALPLPQVMEDSFLQATQLDFLGGFNLIQKQKKSGTLASLNAVEGQEKANNIHTKRKSQTEQNISKNVLNVLSSLEGRN